MVNEKPRSAGVQPKTSRVRRLVRIALRATLGLIAVCAVLLIGIYAVLALTEGEKAPSRGVFPESKRRPLVMAHRGGAAIGPENTIEVFRKAVSLGVDVLEIDVRLTSDGEFVVIHDSKVDRTTEGTGEVSAMTVGELKSLDAGHDFTTDGGATFPYRGKGVTVPTLAEVLAEFPSSNINIEAKQVGAEHASAFCADVRAGGSPERIVVASVSGAFLQSFRGLCPEFPTSASLAEVTAFLTYQKIGVTRSFSPEMSAMQVPMRLPIVDIVSSDFVTSARERGLEVHVWTVNDEQRMRELIGLGVDGIITDRPDILISLLAQDLR